MKKQWKGFAAGCVTALLALSFCIPALASTVKQLNAIYNGIKITLDGKELVPKDSKGTVVEPFIVDGQIYLPLQAVAQAAGLGVGWDQNTNTVILSSKGPVTDMPANNPAGGKGTYSIGETWVVPGQWELTITGVKETSDRNKFADEKPGAVYIIDYTYKNLGYKDKIMDGLFMSIDETIVDSAGKMGYRYPGDKKKYAQEIPVGATCDAQSCVGVENPGNFTLTVSQYDGNSIKQKAVFSISVG